jgi:hypothetical protein
MNEWSLYSHKKKYLFSPTSGTTIQNQIMLWISSSQYSSLKNGYNNYTNYTVVTIPLASKEASTAGR